VGGEIEHAQLIAELIGSEANRFGRVGARLPAIDHPRFEAVVKLLVDRVGARLPYLMLPKPRGVADVQRAADIVDEACLRQHKGRVIPLHALVETHGALREVHALAAHPRIESLSFGLMDFVSAHRGAIPQWAMGVEGQFDHPLVVRAKLEIAAACHAHGKTPAHGVVTEFNNTRALAEAVGKARDLLGFTRMWSIHPAQVRTIVEAFTPSAADVDEAVEILMDARAARWAPIRHRDTLHDRASYRYFWHVLERAHRTDPQGVPVEVREAFFSQA
jgi:citrate lyase subunit beta/citryl-CoA lyase